MLEKSDKVVSDVLKVFNPFEIEVGLLVPTKTGMEKSIMDATASMRDYLDDMGFHDYGRQAQGPDAKVTRRAYLVWPDQLEETTVSMYRPVTKRGDPRIWIGKLKRYASPFNLLAIFVHGDDLYVVNCSKDHILTSIDDNNSPLRQIVDAMRPAIDPAVDELLGMLREIALKGFLPSLRMGDTGIGMTLETLLGIAANNSKAPDYKGIEIKARRLGKRAATRSTLFSQVPAWDLSPIGTAWNLLSRFGYQRDGKLRLNHQIDARGPNSLGLLLAVDVAKEWLRQDYVDPALGTTEHIVTWQLGTLRQRLVEKHKQTFWVGAKSRGSREREEFHYVQVQHTKTPSARNFDALLEAGLISVDYLMSQKTIGKPAVRDHGYLFKINPRDFDALFPPPDSYLLTP